MNKYWIKSRKTFWHRWWRFVYSSVTDLNSGWKNRSAEVGHVDAQQVTDFLGGCRRDIEVIMEEVSDNSRVEWDVRCLYDDSVITCVVWHRGLVRVTLLLKGHVPQLQHSWHHLQQTWWQNRQVIITPKITFRGYNYWLYTIMMC